MSIAGETTRRAKPAFVARTRLAFAAFLATLLGMGVAPQATQAAAHTNHTPSSAAERSTPDRAQGHSHTEHLGRSPLTTTVAGALPHAPREEHSPGGSGGILPAVGGPAAYPTNALLAAASERELVPGTTALALPEVRGPPVPVGR